MKSLTYRTTPTPVLDLLPSLIAPKTNRPRIGCSEKTVQTTITRLVELGFINRIERRKAADRSDSNIYDFSPLIAQLKVMAIEEAAIVATERKEKDERMKPAWKKTKLKAVA